MHGDFTAELHTLWAYTQCTGTQRALDNKTRTSYCQKKNRKPSGSEAENNGTTGSFHDTERKSREARVQSLGCLGRQASPCISTQTCLFISGTHTTAHGTWR